ncbi:MAG: GH3 auxin-responsive promoter family protein [Prevotellaceae bacterium]|jgi:hypothetical protein|nr:GH3 auxin-responsive promoter family protein [Prevotellaceae bacterium]
MKVKRTKGVWKIKMGLGIVGLIELAKLKKNSKNTKRAQEKVLRSILTQSKDTVFGKEHNFEAILQAKNADELLKKYAENIKISQYEDFEPYIERHKNGEENVLFPGKPILYLTTSGTTNIPKWIPLTQNYYKDGISKLNQLWFYTALKYRPHVCDGKTLSIVGKAFEGAAPDGTPYGSISGLSQRDIPEFMKGIYSAPYEIFLITDYKARYYALMRMAIMQNITWIITANPSTLIEMQNNANEFYDEYVKDIENGTISDKVDISPEIREALLKTIQPDPERAAQLRALKEKYSTVLPKHYWENLQVISVWMCGNTNVYMQKVQNSFPKNTLFFEFSYFSSECRSGNVINPSKEIDTTLFCHKIYFEFIKDCDIDQVNPHVYQANEVEIGQRYYIFCTTPSGLYRYNMNDIVEVTGRYSDFPKIRFIQKGNGIISLTGEKLSERQFIDAVNFAEKEANVNLKFFVGFADVENSQYHFYYEFPQNIENPAETGKKITEMVDKKLEVFNREYQEKRGSNRLKSPQTHILQKEAFETFKARCIDLGYRDGQFKLNLLMQNEEKRTMFEELKI